MICLEISFDQPNKDRLEEFIMRSGILYFEKCYERSGCLKVYVTEKESQRIKNTLKNCEWVHKVRNLTMEEIMI